MLAVVAETETEISTETETERQVETETGTDIAETATETAAAFRLETPRRPLERKYRKQHQPKCRLWCWVHQFRNFFFFYY